MESIPEAKISLIPVYNNAILLQNFKNCNEVWNYCVFFHSSY